MCRIVLSIEDVWVMPLLGGKYITTRLSLKYKTVYTKQFDRKLGIFYT